MFGLAILLALTLALGRARPHLPPELVEARLSAIPPRNISVPLAEPALAVSTFVAAAGAPSS